MGNSSTPDERRQFKRIQFDCKAFLESDSGEAHAIQLLDISLNGASVGKSGDWAATQDQHLLLRIELGEGGEQIRMECRVAHQSDTNLGLHCINMDIDSAAHLRRVVELNLGDPELLNRELSALGQ